LLSLRERLELMRVEHPPFARTASLPRAGAHWVRPELVVQVAFMEWTAHGKLRHPRFVRLRDDKVARDVVREPS
jgi:ATP-dependent DNA ligase